MALNEYLLNVLGVQNVTTIFKDGPTQTVTVYPVSTFIAFTNYKSLSKKKYATQLKAMDATTVYSL